MRLQVCHAPLQCKPRRSHLDGDVQPGAFTNGAAFPRSDGSCAWAAAPGPAHSEPRTTSSSGRSPTAESGFRPCCCRSARCHHRIAHERLPSLQAVVDGSRSGPSPQGVVRCRRLFSQIGPMALARAGPEHGYGCFVGCTARRFMTNSLDSSLSQLFEASSRPPP